tara:strand:- start:396 stop:899 length:504 start_codon:yes stop_codon:yes gene_type:complete
MDQHDIILILSFILPFTNEICNVFTSSGYKIFRNLYRPCIDEYILDEKVKKYIKNKKICKNKDIVSKLIIDFIALAGIILNIGRATLEYGYFVGFASGLSIVMLSFILPNLFLHKLIHFTGVKKKYMKIIVGLIIISILLGLSVFMEYMIKTFFDNVILDPELEEEN